MDITRNTIKGMIIYLNEIFYGITEEDFEFEVTYWNLMYRIEITPLTIRTNTDQYIPIIYDYVEYIRNTITERINSFHLGIVYDVRVRLYDPIRNTIHYL